MIAIRCLTHVKSFRRGIHRNPTARNEQTHNAKQKRNKMQKENQKQRLLESMTDCFSFVIIFLRRIGQLVGMSFR